MTSLDNLAPFAGQWRGTNRLHDPNTNRPEDSPSRLAIEPLLSGKFLRLRYTWQYQGAPQEGVLLLGYDTGTKEASGHWIDTWHMGRGVLACRGAFRDENTLDIKGSYAAPSGPDWGWRIELIFTADSVRLLMFNIDPEGQSSPAVEATYSRSEPTMNFADIGQIALVVSDVAKALPFYRDVLGLSFLFSPSPDLAFLSAGGVRVMLSPPQGAGKVGENSVLYFKVKDVESVYQQIVDRGAIAEQPPHLIAKMPDHELWIGFVRDPDRNLIGLMEEKR